MYPNPEPTSYCAKCGYDLRLLPENRCPECGTTFRADRSARHQEEVAILNAAERATARAVVGLLTATIPCLVLAVILCATTGVFPDSDASWAELNKGIVLAVSLVFYGFSILWLGWQLLHALRLDNYCGVVGALLVFAVWSAVGMVIEFLLTLMVISMHTGF